MSFEVAVCYVDNAGRRTADRINGQPCIEIGIAWDSEAGEARILHPRSVETVVGLIDTGAQGILADEALISRHRMPWTREMNSRTGNANSRTRGHVCQLHFPKHDWTTRQEVFSSPLRAQGNPYDLLLGRVFLQSCEFEWTSGGISSVRFVTPTDPLKDAS
ncbi:retropepsin-like aspartic protease [Mesorhizobium sp. CN5-321]|uniref:retropepsin-like aspartic protease n=1 Tax=Mesorhizobium hunchu TaxID=3157708 RepID=UPI0032B766C1